MTDPLVGKQVSNFIIRERIGQGGMATVYLAYQPSVNRNVALKIITINAVTGEREEFRLRFAQEAQVIAGLEHAHILPVYDYGIHDNEIAYIAMRLLPGGTLGDLLADGPLEFSRTAEIFSQIALGLSYAHRKNVIHRDLKPGNILFDESGFAYLSDFGLAKISGNSLGLTQPDAIVGTPTYMSPEQLRGAKLDNRSDIYSLGCVLYHMLVGYQPFADSATDIISIIYQQLEKEPTLPREVNPQVPPAVEQVVLRALSKDREARYSTADEMATALNAALGRDLRSKEVVVGKPASPSPSLMDDVLITRVPPEPAVPVPEPPPPTPPARQANRWLIPGAVALVLVVAAVALSLGALRPPEPTSTPAPTSTELPALVAETAAPTNTELPVLAAAETETPAPTEAPPTETQSATETPAPTEAPPTTAPSPVSATQSVAPLQGTGGEIAFVSDRDGNNKIYLMDSDGSNATRLTDDPNNDMELTWSPDGTQIIFTSYNADANIENHIINADGSDRRPITTWYGWEPAWSPDSTKIVFGAYGETTGDIFVIDADGTNLRQLTNNDFDESYPAWSPDGTQIVYAVRQDGQEDLYIMDADGGNVRALTEDAPSDLYPAWSPDGTQIAFQSDRDGTTKIHIIDADGNNLHPLSSDPLDGYEPSWSPDGSQITFWAYGDSSTGEIYVANADGTNIRRLTDNDTEDRSPVWRP